LTRLRITVLLPSPIRKNPIPARHLPLPLPWCRLLKSELKNAGINMDQNETQKMMLMFEKAAKFSEPGPGVTRLLGTPEHKALLVEMEKWMSEAGLSTHVDAAGNLVGRCMLAPDSDKTFIIGSHQDTVVQGGKYDGMLGIIVPIITLSRICRKNKTLPFNVEIIAFSDEEGARFPTTLIGSSPLAGKFDMNSLKVKDKTGATLEQALLDIGGRPAEIPGLTRDPAKTAGYLEIHIEQGPVLENKDIPVGIVSAITGIERHRVVIKGQAGHAGTIPMELRKDALVGAAQTIMIVDKTCKDTRDLVGVVGSLYVGPNAVNVVPGRVELTVELRSPDSKIRTEAREKIFTDTRKILAGLNLNVEHELTYSQDEVNCSPMIQAGLEQAIASMGITPCYLFSGAGHDGLAMSYLTDIGMLFVRCKKGVSHHPDESIRMEDALTASKVLEGFLENMKE
jgi:allantoate deiminase